MNGPILVATDGGNGALGALRLAAALQQRDGVEPQLLSVIEPIVLEGSVLYAVPGQALALAVRPDEALRDAVKGQVRDLGAPISSWEPRLEVGPVAPAIARVAEEISASMVLLGIGRHSRVDRWLRGETVLDVVRLSRVPVLAVQPWMRELPRRVVVAVDFSEYSRDAAHAVMDLVAENAFVRLVHVVYTAAGEDGEPLGTDEWETTYRSGARVRLEELAGELSGRPGVRIETTTLEGRPVDQLQEEARRINADLIVAGSHGYGFFTRLVMGSVSTRLLRTSDSSLLIAPPRMAEASLRNAIRQPEHANLPAVIA